MGILKHHLHFWPEVTQFPFAEPAYIPAVEKNLAASRFDQAQNQSGQSRFFAPGLPDDAENFATTAIEGDVVNSRD